MGVFNTLFKRKDQASLQMPLTLAVSIATLTATHQNAAKEIMSKKEQTIAHQAGLKLAEARKGLHAIEHALHLRDQEYAVNLVVEAKRDLQEYCTLTAPLVKLEHVRREVDTLQKKLVDLEKRVLLDRV